MRQLKVFGLHYYPMVSKRRQCKITRPIVCLDCATGGDHGAYKATEAICRGIWDLLKTYAADPLWPLVFHGDSNQRLTCGTTATFARLIFASNKCLVNLDTPQKLITVWPYHSPAQFVQPLPSGLISQAKDTLKSHGVGAIFLARNMPHRPKPQKQRFACVLKYGSGRHRSLSTALTTMPQCTARQPAIGTGTTRAYKAIRPSQLGQIVDACSFSAKTGFEITQRDRVVLIHNDRTLHVVAT